MNFIVQNIRILRIQRGWSQQEFARRLDISIPAFSKIENGITELKVSRLYQLATVLELPISQLATRTSAELETLTRREDALNKRMLDMNLAVFHLQQTVIDLYEALSDDPG